MKLADLHKRFSRDATYRDAHAEASSWVPLGLHLRAIRESKGLSRRALAKELEITDARLARIERGLERDYQVVLPLVQRWGAELQANGFDLGPWLSAALAHDAQPIDVREINALLNVSDGKRIVVRISAAGDVVHVHSTNLEIIDKAGIRPQNLPPLVPKGRTSSPPSHSPKR